MEIKYVDLRNARSLNQNEVLREIILAGEDPFDRKNVLRHHKEKNGVIYENLSWYIINNQWPYKNAKHHFVLILQKYKEDIVELDEVELVDLTRAISWLKQEYGLLGGGLVMRTGETVFSGATCRRLHGHFIVPDIKSPDYNTENRVSVVIGGNPENQQ